MVEQKLPPEEIFQRKEELGIDNSIRLLTEIIEKEKRQNKRISAVKYIGLMGKKTTSLKTECYNTLENILISEEEEKIKCEAAKALGKLKFEKGLKPLKWILKEHPDDLEIKLSSLKAIIKIQFKDEEIKLFIQELDSPFNSVKDYVRNQLLSLNPEVLIKILLKSIKIEQFSGEHILEIIKLLGLELSSINVSFEDASYLKVKYPEVLTELKANKRTLLDVITNYLKEEDNELMNAILTICKLIQDEIKDDLMKFLMVDDFIVKKNAVKLCGKLKILDAADLLISNLDNIYNEVTIASIKALGEIGDVSAVPELLEILDIEEVSFEYTDLDMKLFILDAVKNIYLVNKDASYESLFSNLKKDNDTIKESIAFIFGEIGKKDFVNPLMDLLNERNLDIKKNAIIALGKIGDINPLEDLIGLLNSESTYWLIKKVTADAIYNIFHRNWYKLREDDKELKRKLNKNLALVIDHLRNYEDENFKVKLSLIKFLETYGGKKALDALMKRVNDFHRVVRIHASNAIKRIEEKLELENS